MLRLGHISAAGLLLLGLSANLSAETVKMPEVTIETTEVPVEVVEETVVSTEMSAEMTEMPKATPPGTTEYSIQLPGRGMSMEAVQNRFGQAVEKSSAVGEPPITRWSYNGFSVYFESEFVIHAVVNN